MNQKIRNMNTTALAYMGDAVYEVYIRQWAMASGQPAADKLHAMAVPFVKASGQAQAVRELMKGFLTDDELALAKRARNHRTSSKPRNADPVEYKLATAFEALIGALYLSGETDRIEEIIGEALNIIESDLKVKKIKPGASYSRHTKEKESKNE